MLRSLLVLGCLVSVAATCAPNTPKPPPGCSPLSPAAQNKCSQPPAMCEPAAFTKTDATCSRPTAFIYVETDEIVWVATELKCKGDTWWTSDFDLATGMPREGPLPGGNVQVACVFL